MAKQKFEHFQDRAGTCLIRKSAGGRYVGELMDFLKPFWGGEHEAEIWELYKRWTRYADANEPTLRAEAERAGVSLRGYVYRTALEQIRKYVNKRPRLAEILRYTSTSKAATTEQARQYGGAFRALAADFEKA